MVYEMAAEEPQWFPLELRHVRLGDVIRPRGTEQQSTVTDRYWAPDPTGKKARGSWHVVAGEKHWDDVVVDDTRAWLCLDGAAQPTAMRLDFAIDILMMPAEHAAVELLGWENRAKG